MSRHRSSEPVITLASLPLRAGSSGKDVADLQRRLAAAGFPSPDEPGEFGAGTGAAVAEFQRSVRLRSDGICDAGTWSALVESGYHLGDRLLCLRSPMMRGDDVSDLQLRLGKLGFDAGRVDGIFGPETQAAVGEFQRNAGLVTDQVCGPDTVAALHRLQGRAGSAPVNGVRERDRLRKLATERTDLRVVIGMAEPLHPVATGLATELHRHGVSTLLTTGTWSEQAELSNRYGADVYLGIVVDDVPRAEVAYFSAKGYESFGGRSLAERIIEELPAAPGWGVGSIEGMRTAVLRETRSPAALLTLGPPDLVDEHAGLVVAALHRALTAWSTDPSVST